MPGLSATTVSVAMAQYPSHFIMTRLSENNLRKLLYRIGTTLDKKDVKLLIHLSKSHIGNKIWSEECLESVERDGPAVGILMLFDAVYGVMEGDHYLSLLLEQLAEIGKRDVAMAEIQRMQVEIGVATPQQGDNPSAIQEQGIDSRLVSPIQNSGPPVQEFLSGKKGMSNASPINQVQVTSTNNSHEHYQRDRGSEGMAQTQFSIPGTNLNEVQCVHSSLTSNSITFFQNAPPNLDKNGQGYVDVFNPPGMSSNSKPVMQPEAKPRAVEPEAGMHQPDCCTYCQSNDGMPRSLSSACGCSATATSSTSTTAADSLPDGASNGVYTQPTAAALMAPPVPPRPPSRSLSSNNNTAIPYSMSSNGQEGPFQVRCATRPLGDVLREHRTDTELPQRTECPPPVPRRPEHPGGEVDEYELLQLSRVLHASLLYPLGQELGLITGRVSHHEYQNPRCISQAFFHMMVEWRSGQGDRYAMRQTLAGCLRKIDCMDEEKKLCTGKFKRTL